ncbi:hypothetical protein bas19_0052 [Escherichia phage ChristophMerian]|nr:hypothetical protein bas19_0052 [Escherichia phage ChristophMerian]
MARKFMVSYHFVKDQSQQGFGNVEVTMPDIRIETIREVEQLIREQNCWTGLVILNVIELELEVKDK